MSEPLHVRIRAAHSPLDAISMLVAEIEVLHSCIEALSKAQADPWAQPLEWGGAPIRLDPSVPPGEVRIEHPEDPYVGLAPVARERAKQLEEAATAQQLKIEKLRARIAEEVDPDNLRALEASLRLALEEHVHLPSAAVPSLEPEEGGVIEVPPPSPERIAARMQWARENNLADYMMNAEAIKAGNATDELYANFGRIGPKGIYVMDRLALLQMPVAARQWLVEDMAQDDEAYAQNMGADLLKSEDGMDRETARELYSPTWKG